MEHTQTAALGHEWATLQNNYEQYEKNSLLIKLGGIALLAFSLAWGPDPAAAVLLLAILWVQEGIFRTCQSRLGSRILRVEQLLKGGAPQAASCYQLHSEWLAARPGLAGLLTEYLRSMLRPTVAFPHVLLVLIAVAAAWQRQSL